MKQKEQGVFDEKQPIWSPVYNGLSKCSFVLLCTAYTSEQKLASAHTVNSCVSQFPSEQQWQEICKRNISYH